MTIFAKVYLDEDVDILVAHLLTARGLDLTTAREQKMLGKTDPEQLLFATSLERCFLTHNRLDFEQLHTNYLINGQEHRGILIAKRRNSYEIAERIAILLDTLTADEIANQLLYI
jgi:predicted nuclease of predicted toxin-antitoxin system